jgi:hypothetical protein
VPHLSFEADAKGGRNVLATLNAISQTVLTQYQASQERQSQMMREMVAA